MDAADVDCKRSEAADAAEAADATAVTRAEAAMCTAAFAASMAVLKDRYDALEAEVNAAEAETEFERRQAADACAIEAPAEEEQAVLEYKGSSSLPASMQMAVEVDDSAIDAVSERLNRSSSLSDLPSMRARVQPDVPPFGSERVQDLSRFEPKERVVGFKVPTMHHAQQDEICSEPSESVVSISVDPLSWRKPVAPVPAPATDAISAMANAQAPPAVPDLVHLIDDAWYGTNTHASGNRRSVYGGESDAVSGRKDGKKKGFWSFCKRKLKSLIR